ncbi:MAG: ral secretion pathway protein [Sphingomonadales bacterium]|jgi:general secretion pathway protein C|nr:ral secretion pathway protein [Sphingomonadales bacterium]
MAYDLSLREKRLIQAAGIAIILFLLYLLFLRGGSGPVVPVARPEPQAVPQPIPPPPAAVVATPPPAPPADISGLRLHGLLASGAVIGFPSGRQRLVPVGRDALPGLTLRRIEQNAAVFDSAGGELRLGFDGPIAAAPGAPAPAPLTASAGGAQREEALRYRLGLAPRRAGGRVTGFTVRANVEMPALARAGIRPGDVIVAVNGSAFDEERMQELAWQIANSTRLDFEVERAGQRLRLSLPRR